MATPFNQDHIDNLIQKASELSYNSKHAYVSLEHISLILLEDITIANAIKSCGGDV